MAGKSASASSYNPTISTNNEGGEQLLFIGQSPAFLDFQERLRRVAPVDRPVLLIGERGTGKELAAKYIHFLSKRWERPFVTLHCASLSPTLIESELFGHERGSFTGAHRLRVGRFEAADTGSVFLDEMSLIPIETQEKILRVVEYGSFERVGGDETVHVNARIIGATNVDLSRASERGKFKRDLLDRLSFEVLFLPPLRERREDIMLLSRQFASRICLELGRPEIPEFTEEVEEELENYNWPGNIRELKNVVERAVYRADGPLISAVEFNPFESPYATLSLEEEDHGYGAPSDGPPQRPAPARGDAPNGAEAADGSLTCVEWDALSLPEALQRVEVAYVWKALRSNRFNKKAAAEQLGLTYDQFRGLYRKHQDGLELLEEKELQG